MLTRDKFLHAPIGTATAAGLCMPRAEAAAPPPARKTASVALQTLLEGNKRYAADRPMHSEHGIHREETASRQHPFAVVLSCSDSRVSPEILFDEGIGELFVVRVAGNVASDVCIGSIEYAVSHFTCSLLLVLGHTNCGAVHAAVDALEHHEPAPGQIETIVQEIIPAANAARHEAGDVYLNVTKANARAVTAKLRVTQPILKEAVDAKRLEIVPALYTLKTGYVSLL